MERLLDIQDLKTHFFTEDGVVRAVDGVSYDVCPGEMVGVVGESGCGKSVTSLSVMRLLPEPMGRIVNGKVLFQDCDLSTLPEKKMRNVRGCKMAMIFQEPMTSLNPVLSVGYQLDEVLGIHSDLSSVDRHARCVELLDLVGIPDPARRLQDYPHQMSGGMRQRVMIAMGLACNPELLIADEPTTALDVTIQAQILELLADLQKKLHMGVVLITHNLGVVAEMAQRIVVMYAGKVAERAKTEDLFAAPAHPYTAGLLESIPKLHQKKGERTDLATIPGMVPHPSQFPGGCRFHPRCPFVMEKCREEEPPLFEIADEHQVACWLYESGRPESDLDLKGAFLSATASTERKRTCDERLLEVRGLKKHFAIKSRWGEHKVVKAVDGVSFCVRRGETLGLVGESGCGKTTTGKVIVGLEEPTEGQVLYKGLDLASMHAAERRRLSRKVQMVFQDPYSSLNPRMTVKEIVSESLNVHRLVKNDDERKERVAEALRDSGLDPAYMNRYAHEFSGGQRQRIGIARSLIMNPELIVCDEPVSALDVSIQAQVINLLQKLQSEHDLTYLFVAHDLSVVRHISDRVVVMYLGQVMESAETDVLFEEWKHPYTEALLSAVPEPVPNSDKKRIVLQGDVPSPINPPKGCPFNTRCPRKKGVVCEQERPPLIDLGDGHEVACWWFA